MLRVLLCTERRDDWLLASAFLARDSEEYELDWASSCQHAEAALGQGTYDAYLVDAALGGGRGLAMAQAAARRCTRPILILTRRADPALEKRALSSGVADVLVRPEITPHWLDQAIRHAVTRAEEGAEDKHGGAVRFGVMQARARQAVGRARRGLGGVAVLALSVDWKNISESRAALADASLRDAALERLLTCLREVDTVTYTGDGFVILVEDTDARLVAARLADQLLGELSAPFTIRSAVYEVAATAGAAVFPDDGESPEDLLSHARQSLDAARAAGGGGTRFPSRQTDMRLARRILLEKSAAGAMERGDFRLVYQPQVDAFTGMPVGVEALLRWKHSHLGEVSPSEFIPILEGSDLINKVGTWVMRTACVQASRWMTDGIEIRVSVNVSARQFEQGTVGESIAEALAASKLPARLLGVELTESIMLDSSASVRDTLMSLRESGVHIAVDDFGTGYASLRYVKHFPMDTIKIDREFVRGLPLDVHNAAITNSIVALARSLKLGVVAEGVETDAEQEFLRSLECEVVQGFLHARPLEPSDFEAWFLSRKSRAVRSRPAVAQAAESVGQSARSAAPAKEPVDQPT